MNADVSPRLYPMAVKGIRRPMRGRGFEPLKAIWKEVGIWDLEDTAFFRSPFRPSARAPVFPGCLGLSPDGTPARLAGCFVSRFSGVRVLLTFHAVRRWKDRRFLAHHL